MDRSDIARFRLHSQSISGSRPKTAAELLARLGGIQGQDYYGAKWSMGLRLLVNDTAIESAISDKSIVRTWLMRGTLAFAGADDVHWMLKLLAPRIIAGSARRHEALNLDDAQFERCFGALRTALQGGALLTREETLGAVEHAGVSIDSHRGYHVLWRSALEGHICLGPMRGKQQTFALLEDWVTPREQLDRDEALARLAMRYFTSRGPATVQDFIWWSGLPAADARAGLELAKPSLSMEKAEDHVYWMSNDTPAETNASPYLLPGFDEYLLGYKNRDATLNPKYAEKWCPGGNGVFAPFFVLNGQVAGTWKKTVKKNRIVVIPQAFKPMEAKELEALAEPTKRYAEFLGCEAVIEFP